MNLGDVIVWFSFISGTHYNLTNLYYAFKGAKSKLMALKYTFPYLQLYVIAYCF